MSISVTILDNHMSAAGNAPYISNKLNGLLKVTSFGPLHELRLDEKPDRWSGEPHNEHKYPRFKDFVTHLTQK